jgi:hypothetical protein
MQSTRDQLQQLAVDIIYPIMPDEQGEGTPNPIVSASDYKVYSTSKNQPAQVKNSNLKKKKSEVGVIPGYNGDVLE